MASLYDPIVLGDMKLSNRVFMAPLTRNRATPNGVAGGPAFLRFRFLSHTGTPGAPSSRTLRGWE